MKHLTRAHADEQIDGILEEFGAEGYGVYWLIFEEIAQAMEAPSLCFEIVHSDIKWASITRVSVRAWRSISARLAERSLIERTSVMEPMHNDNGSIIKPMRNDRESNANRTRIAVPKLLKYIDEYTKKSGQTPESVRSRLDKNRLEEKISTPPVPSPAPKTNGAVPHPPLSLPSPPTTDEIKKRLADHANGNGKGLQSVNGALHQEWPKTGKAVRSRFPTCNDQVVNAIVQSCLQAYLSCDEPKIKKPDDELLSRAIEICWDEANGRQFSPNMFIKTGPALITNWANHGKPRDPWEPIGG